MFIKRVKIGAGDALLYKLSDPIEESTNVVVSAATAPPIGDRVTIFPANQDGDISSWKALAEKTKTLDHEEILTDLGYQVM